MTTEKTVVLIPAQGRNKIIKNYAEEYMSTQIYEGFRRFRDYLKVRYWWKFWESRDKQDWENITDDFATVKGNLWMTVNMLAKDMQINYGSVVTIIIEDLHMRGVSALVWAKSDSNGPK